MELLSKPETETMPTERCCMKQPVYLSGQPDGVLVLDSLAGDEGAFETLVQRYHGPLFQFIRRQVSDSDQAWDVVQQVLLKLFVALPTLSTRQTHLGPWLFRVARNCCIDEYRKRHLLRFADLGWEGEDEGEEPVPPAELIDPSPSPEEVVEQHEVQRWLLEAIGGLPQRWRQVVLLRYWQQLSFAEIGQRLQMPASTAKVYFCRARPLLRARLNASAQAPSCLP